MCALGGRPSLHGDKADEADDIALVEVGSNEVGEGRVEIGGGGVRVKVRGLAVRVEECLRGDVDNVCETSARGRE